MKFDRYNREARFLPAILTLPPFLLLYFFFLDAQLGEFFEFIFQKQWIGDISTATAFLFLLAFVGRAIAKDIFEGYWFKSDETQMPTTDILLYSNKEYSDQFKEKIRGKIMKDFRIDIPLRDIEANDECHARKTIAEAVCLIRGALKDGRLLLDRNIEYGFIRNFIGCSVAAVITTLVNVYIFTKVQNNYRAYILSVVMLVIYLLPIVFSKILIKAHGKRYARTLYQEYMGD